MKTIRYSIIAIIIIAASAAAQPGEMGGRFGKPMERLERYKKIRMVEALGLDEETGIKLVSRYSKHRERMKDLEEERAGVVEKLEGLNKSNTSEADYQKVFNELFDIEKRMMEARKRYLDELKEVLTVKQVAQYIVFERDFMKDVRETMRDIQKERMRR